MRVPQSIQLLVTQVALALACAACSGTVPPIRDVPGANQVKTTTNESEVTECQRLSLETASDGKLGKGTGAYVGTAERALIRLLNRVVETGGDTILIVNPDDPRNTDMGLISGEIAMDCEGQCGAVVWKAGIVFRCRSE